MLMFLGLVGFWIQALGLKPNPCTLGQQVLISSKTKLHSPPLQTQNQQMHPRQTRALHPTSREFERHSTFTSSRARGRITNVSGQSAPVQILKLQQSGSLKRVP